MNKQIEALKMAIKILSQDEGWFDPSEAIKACKEALAEAENPELVAVQYLYRADPDNPEMIPLYTHPATWQSLDMQEIGELSIKASEQLIQDGLPEGEYAFEFYELIEQALKELNAKK